MSYLGIDIGTTGAKAVVFDQNGRLLSSDYGEYPLICPQNGWFELDASQVMKTCKKIIACSAERVKSTDPVRAIGISSQGEAFTVLDKKGDYLCNAMVSLDSRSQKQVQEFPKSIGEMELYQITGHSAHTLFSVFKLLWIKQHRPEIFGAIYRLLCFGDLLAYELTGETQISYNLASRTMLFDVKQCSWSVRILKAVGLDPGVLSKPVQAGHAAGYVAGRIADEMGLEHDVKVVAGGHDQCCGALGVGAGGAGLAAYSIGTVECITPAFSACVLNDTMRLSNLATYPHVVEGLYTTVAFTTCGGSLLRWFRDTLGTEETEMAMRTGQDVYDLLLRNIPLEPTGLFVLPHFASTGTPYFDPSPLGVVLGLSLTTTKGELAKAILEGITYEMKINLELLGKAGIAVGELRAFGGGTKSDAWMQIKADILNIPITTLAVVEAGCLGAAMLAGRACGTVGSLQDCARAWIRPQQTYEPQPKMAACYKSRFEMYSSIYDSLKPLREMKNQLINS